MSVSLAQERARHALQKIKELEASDNYGNYVAYVKSLPATILMSGLGQALAMEKVGATSKTNAVKAGHGKLFEHVSDWLLNHWPSRPDEYTGGELMEVIISSDQADYMRAQTETLAYLEWLKKFAVAAPLKSPDDEAKP